MDSHRGKEDKKKGVFFLPILFVHNFFKKTVKYKERKEGFRKGSPFGVFYFQQKKGKLRLFFVIIMYLYSL